jgi:hypothetical protein
MSGVKWGRRSASLGLIAAIAACDAAHKPVELPPAEVGLATHTAGAAERAVGPDGRFVLRAPPTLARRQITSEEALKQAVAYVTTLGSFHVPFWEKRRGAPVAVSELRPSGPVYYAASPYDQDRIPAGTPGAFGRYRGPYYFVTFADAAGRPAVVVAVSAYNTHVSLANGKVGYTTPLDQGGEFLSRPVPLRRAAELPITAERAVTLVGAATGRRAVEVPELVLPPFGHMPHLARWRARLDRPAVVTAAGGGTRSEEAEVYVGMWGGTFRPKPAQPGGSRIRAYTSDAILTVPRAAGRPIDFEPVTLIRTP